MGVDVVGNDNQFVFGQIVLCGKFGYSFIDIDDVLCGSCGMLFELLLLVGWVCDVQIQYMVGDFRVDCCLDIEDVGVKQKTLYQVWLLFVKLKLEFLVGGLEVLS